jgi:hypothetical protein
VLITDGDLQRLVDQYRLKSVDQLKEILNECRQTLLEYRSEHRPRPHRDEKCLASWNGLMISGLARAASVLQQKQYIKLAEQAMKFIRQYLINPTNRRLLRVCYIDPQTNDIDYTYVKGFVCENSSCSVLVEGNRKCTAFSMITPLLFKLVWTCTERISTTNSCSSPINCSKSRMNYFGTTVKIDTSVRMVVIPQSSCVYPKVGVRLIGNQNELFHRS